MTKIQILRDLNFHEPSLRRSSKDGDGKIRGKGMLHDMNYVMSQSSTHFKYPKRNLNKITSVKLSSSSKNRGR